MLNPFVKDPSSELFGNVSTESSNVNGFIFINNQQIVSNESYDYPPIISLTDYSTGLEIARNYTFNSNLSDSPLYVSFISHTFIERCYFLDWIIPFYFFMCTFWGVVTGAWIYIVYFRFKMHSLYLQKVLTLFPFCKIWETMVSGFFYRDCPWVTPGNGSNSSERYANVSRIIIFTISYTIFLALLYLISKGWNTLSFQMTRN